MILLEHVFIILSMSVTLTSTQSVRACFYAKHAGDTQSHDSSRLEPKDIAPGLCTHIVLDVFKVGTNLKLTYKHSDSEQLINQATELKLNKIPEIKLIMGVYEDSGNGVGITQFEQAANASRGEFIADVVSMFEQHSLDGVNIRFKWPSLSTKASFASFLSFLRSTLNTENTKRQQLWTISATLNPNGDSRDIYVYSTLQTLDLLFIETTGQEGSWNARTGHFSPLKHGSGNDLTSGALFYKRKLPSQKLVFQIPLEGQIFRLKSESANGIGAKSVRNSKPRIFSHPYYTTCKDIRGGTYKFDKATSSSYYYKGLDWVSFDSNQVRCLKLKWLYNNGLTGGWYAWVNLDDAFGDCGDGPFPVLNYMKNNSNGGILSEDCDSEALKPNINVDCPDGKYGRLCRHNCSDYSDPPKTCDFITGACNNCQPGYVGQLCNYKCDTGSYGYNCTEQCGTYCDPPNTCNHVTGECRCQVGYAPELCKSKCDPGKYGDNCSQTCSRKCQTDCNHITGHCQCPSGYRPDTCHDKCHAGTYGFACLQLCGNCGGNDTCNVVSGECPGNCELGFFGTFCVPCRAGFYGKNCSLECHCYKNYACDQKTGGCGRYGCKLYWFGELCNVYDDHKCTGNTWGVSCTDCGACKDGPCHRETGLCSTTGCAVNRYGLRCDMCDNDHFGGKCYHTCGQCDGNIPCGIKTGLCLNNKCANGYLGSKCDVECSSERWGEQCENRCSKNCKGAICSNVDGKCTLGSTTENYVLCVNKYDGPLCEHRDNCVSEECEKTSGKCLLGCKPGYKGVRCAEACTHGTYAKDCINYCGLCKDYSQCDVITGRCENGCTGYFKTPFCTECPVGHFGYECNQLCGNCVNKETCDSLTGACPSGCDEDFIGHYCGIRINTDIDIGYFDSYYNSL